MIGILDSGVGGLVTLRAFQGRWPLEPMIYIADTARYPYGTKSAKTICEFALGTAEFIKSQGAHIIIVACQTIGAVAGQFLASELDIPVIDGIVPVAKQALEKTRNGRIGIIGSSALIESGRYQEVIGQLTSQTSKVTVKPVETSLLVPIIHADRINKPESIMIIKKTLHRLKSCQVDTLILANPYYTLLAPVIQRKIGRRVKLVDPTPPFISKLSPFVKSRARGDSHTIPKPIVWATDVTPVLEKIANKIYGQGIHLKPL